MKISEQREMLAEMTEGDWYVEGNRLLTKFYKDLDNEIAVLSYPKEPDGKGIAMMRNHYGALLDLAEVCKQVFYRSKVPNDDGIYEIYTDWGAVRKMEDALEKIEKIDS